MAEYIVEAESLEALENGFYAIKSAEPIKHGRWIKYNKGFGFSHKCSFCDFTIAEQWVDLYNYCPNCGAKMDEVEDE